MKPSSKSFFLISFLPALAYWYLEENYPLDIALAGGLSLAFLEITLEKILTKHVHTLSKFNFLLILVLGGIALLAKEGIWFKLQPCFTGVIMGGYLFYKYLKNESLMYEIVETMNSTPPPKGVIIFLERNLGVFMFLYGIFMAFIAVLTKTDVWLFFKTAGFYIATFIFMIGNTFYLKRMMKKQILFEQMAGKK